MRLATVFSKKKRIFFIIVTISFKNEKGLETNLKNKDFQDDSQSLRKYSKFRLLSDNLSEIKSQATVVDHLREFVLVQT